jgi:hypothetical protein
MNATLLVLQLMGPVVLIYGLGILLNRAYYLKMVDELEKNRLSITLAAMMNIVAGVAILVHHWLWGSFLEVVVTLIGFMALTKGIHIAIAPESWLKMTKGFSLSNMINIVPIIVTILGALMMYAGYFT